VRQGGIRFQSASQYVKVLDAEGLYMLSQCERYFVPRGIENSNEAGTAENAISWRKAFKKAN
jgi:hypothetical protein